MDYKQWVDFFGRTTADKELSKAIAKAGVKKLPIIAKDELRARVELADMRLVFTDEALFPNLGDIGDGHGVLSAVILKLRVPEGAAYTGPLPFDLKRSDSQAALRARFGGPIDEDEEFRWDEWGVDELVLRVTYTKDFASLDQSITVKLPEAN